jgi:hypothetical protein
MSIADLECPEGLPIGPGWVPVPDHTEVVFPYTAEVVSRAPVGT